MRVQPFQHAANAVLSVQDGAHYHHEAPGPQGSERGEGFRDRVTEHTEAAVRIPRDRLVKPYGGYRLTCIHKFPSACMNVLVVLCRPTRPSTQSSQCAAGHTVGLGSRPTE